MELQTLNTCTNILFVEFIVVFVVLGPDTALFRVVGESDIKFFFIPSKTCWPVIIFHILVLWPRCLRHRAYQILRGRVQTSSGDGIP